MEKSIETIWKKGFVENNELIVPKINDLYNQKSKGIMSRMSRLFKLNIVLLYAFAVIMVIMSIAFKLPVLLAIILIALFVLPAVYSQAKVKTIQPVSQFTNCYDYLKSFNNWLNAQIKRNITFARFYYPISVLASASIVWFSDSRGKTMEKLLNSYPDMPLFYGVPVYFLLPVLFFALLMGLFAERIYRFDVGIVYGRAMEKVKELIHDLEELREK